MTRPNLVRHSADHRTTRLSELRTRSDLRRSVAEAPVVDLEARTVDLSFSSTAEVSRWFGIEILSHAPGAMRTGRLNASAPLLWMHDVDDQRGKVVPGTVRLDGNKGRARVMFSRSDAGQQLFQDVQDAIVTSVSVGYFVHDMKLMAVRDDGTEVWLITDWEPYEISMVSVPADIAVGAGRSAEIPKEENIPATRQSSPERRAVRHAGKEPEMNPLEQLRALFDDGARQLGHTSIPREHGGDVVIPKKAATAATFSLRELQTTGMRPQSSIGAGDLPVSEQPAGELIPLSAAILERSRVAQAGARLVVQDPAEEGRVIGDGRGAVLGFQYQHKHFITVEPAPFVRVDDGDDLSESSSPVSRIILGSNGKTDNTFPGPSYGVQFKVTRAQMKAIGKDQLLQELLLSITMGLARAADYALLSAIVATTPAAFTLAAAAARGIEFGALRALVGTSGTGAAVGQDGALRAAGVPAELSPVIAATIIGSFPSAGVAVHDSLRITLQRTNAAGDLILTCWTDVEAVVPDDSFFWTA